MALQIIIDGEPSSQSLTPRPPNPQSLTSQPNTSQTVIDPTFLLRGIDVSKVVEDYLKGEYQNISIPDTKVKSSVREVIADYSIGTDARSEIYEYTDRSGRRQRIVTINHQKYDRVRSQLQNDSYLETLSNDRSKIGDLPPGEICLWCRRKFDFYPIGMPVKIEYLEEDNLTTFHTIGSYCTYECCFSDLKSKTRCPFTYRDHRCMSSESMLRLMFERSYPGEELRDQNDWVLAQWNNGPLNENDFFSKSHVYKREPDIILLPAKYEYSLQQ